jgi:hypothetical protein
MSENMGFTPNGAQASIFLGSRPACLYPSAAWAAASRAMGTRKGEHET